MNRCYKKNSQVGSIYVMTLMIMTVLIVIGVSLVQVLSLNHSFLKKNMLTIKARYLAEAGIELTLVNYLLADANKDWSDDQQQDIYQNVALGEGVFSVSLQQGTNKSIIIAARGEVNHVVEPVNVLVAVDWLKQPPEIIYFQWQKDSIRSTSLIY